jgi:hypothetical protein
MSGEPSRPFGVFNVPTNAGYWDGVKWQAAISATYSVGDMIRLIESGATRGHWIVDEPFQSRQWGQP